MRISQLTKEFEALSSSLQEKEATVALLEGKLPSCQKAASTPEQLSDVITLTVGIVELKQKLKEAEFQKQQVTLEKDAAVQEVEGKNSGGFRNSEWGVQPLAREARPQIFGLPRPLSVTLKVRTEYLEATLGLVKCLEISKELIRECVTMPGCCCCMPLLHNHLMDSCSYVRKNTLLAAKGGCICTPLTPPESATEEG